MCECEESTDLVLLGRLHAGRHNFTRPKSTTILIIPVKIFLFFSKLFLVELSKQCKHYMQEGRDMAHSKSVQLLSTFTTKPAQTPRPLYNSKVYFLNAKTEDKVA